MAVPDLYLEGLTQRALAGEAALTRYKLGVIEALLKEALALDAGGDPEALRSNVGTALEVAVWEPSPPRPPAGGGSS